MTGATPFSDVRRTRARISPQEKCICHGCLFSPPYVSSLSPNVLTQPLLSSNLRAAGTAAEAAAAKEKAEAEAKAKAKADAEKAAVEAAAAAEAERIRLEEEAVAAKAAAEERVRLEAEAAEAARIAALPLSENRGAPTWRKKPTSKVSVGSLLDTFTEGVDVKANWKSINAHGVTGKMEGRDENSGVMKLLRAHESAQKKSEETLTADTVTWGVAAPVHAKADEDGSHQDYEEVLRQRLNRVKMAQQEKDEEERKRHLAEIAAAEEAAAAKAAEEVAKVKAKEAAAAAAKAHEEVMAKEAHDQRMREAELHRLKYAMHEADDWHAAQAGAMQGGDFSDDDGFGFDEDFDC